MEMTNGGVHHSFEAIGLGKTAEQAFNMLRRGGTANVIGMIPIGQTVTLMGAAFLGEKRIQGSLMGSNRFPVDMPRLVDFYMSGKLKLDDMISPPHQAGGRQRGLRRDEAAARSPARSSSSTRKGRAPGLSAPPRRPPSAGARPALQDGRRRHDTAATRRTSSVSQGRAVTTGSPCRWASCASQWLISQLTRARLSCGPACGSRAR